MRNIIYIHGFASSGNSFKGNFLRKEFGEYVVSPNLSSHPLNDINTLKVIIEKYNNPILIGSSLGGFYAEYLSKKLHLDTLLINPLSKVVDIKPFIGTHTYFETGNRFDFTNNDFEDIKILSNEIKNYNLGEECRVILLSKDDDAIPYTDSLNHFTAKNESVTVYETGGHSFNQKEIILSKLNTLLNRIQHNT